MEKERDPGLFQSIRDRKYLTVGQPYIEDRAVCRVIVKELQCVSATGKWSRHLPALVLKRHLNIEGDEHFVFNE
jgi:hypothetical protein